MTAKRSSDKKRNERPTHRKKLRDTDPLAHSYQRDGFRQRWVAVESNEFEYCSGLGYNIVERRDDDSDQNLDPRFRSDRDGHGGVTRRSYSNSSEIMVLMEIPEEEYQEIQKEQEMENREMENGAQPKYGQMIKKRDR